MIPGVNALSYLGGVYDATAKKWITKRVHNSVAVGTTSPLTLIEEPLENKPAMTKLIN
ncbi:hypothetical protein D3C85_1898150 [compost metagenome]